MTQYILSTMANSVRYTTYNRTQPDNPRPIGKGIFIQGGAGIASERSGFGEMESREDGQPIWTAAGFVTPVTDEQYELLKVHPLFVKHEARGLVRVLSKDISKNHGEIQKNAANMATDAFAPMDAERLGTRVKVSNKKLDAEQKFRL